MIDARMDGTPLEQAHWRINALREMLHNIYITAPDQGTLACTRMAKHALDVDDHNATIPAKG